MRRDHSVQHNFIYYIAKEQLKTDQAKENRLSESSYTSDSRPILMLKRYDNGGIALLVPIHHGTKHNADD